VSLEGDSVIVLYYLDLRLMLNFALKQHFCELLQCYFWWVITKQKQLMFYLKYSVKRLTVYIEHTVNSLPSLNVDTTYKHYFPYLKNMIGWFLKKKVYLYCYR
jgi:hypothetical protein